MEPNQSNPDMQMINGSESEIAEFVGLDNPIETGTQKRSRISFEFTAGSSMDPLKALVNNITISDKISYASKVRPKDVKINEDITTEENDKIRVHQPTENDPFKSINFSEDMEELMCEQWKNTILI